MKFTKFGKALLMSALSAGVILCVTSCVRSYTVGYLYVTGTVTAQSNGSGIISGYKIDHNTGFLTPINGMPISSGGANPERAVLIVGSKFFYVLNAGVNAQGGATCTTANPCQNSNITEFAVGGNGIMTPQETFYTQGINPFRMMADTSGNYLLVLDHDSPNNATCKLALGPSATSCGDITVFQINQTTGRLTLVVNAQVTGSTGTGLTYFPVPANPIDFVLASGYIFTLSGLARQLTERLRQLDSTRPITQAVPFAFESMLKTGKLQPWAAQEPAFKYLDVGGYNYEWKQFERDHVRVPNRVMVETESYPIQAGEIWEAVNKLPYAIGDFVWTGMDYIGESGLGTSRLTAPPSRFPGAAPTAPPMQIPSGIEFPFPTGGVLGNPTDFPWFNSN